MSASIIKFQDNQNVNNSDQDFDFDQFAGNVQEESSENSTNMFQEGWIISYVDIITLLLTLFIILLAMSNFNADETPTSEFNISTVETDRKNTNPGQSHVDSNLTVLDTQKMEPNVEQHPGNSITEPYPSDKIAAAVETSTTKPEILNVSEANMLLVSPDTLVENAGNEYLRLDTSKLFNNQIDAEKILPVTTAYAEVSNASSVNSQAVPRMIEPNEVLADDTDQITSPAINARNVLIEQIENSALGNKIEVAEIKDHVNLVISDEMLFSLGSAELKPEGMALLQQLADMIKATNLNISIEGHTDNVPINNAQFPSNWELSTARATLVTRLMIENAIEPSRIRAVGYADTHPRASNDTAQGRERNRRVSILLHVPETTASEQTLAKLQASE